MMGTLAICSYFVWSIIDATRCTRKSQDVVQQMQSLHWILPVSRSERNWFVFGLSTSAGICEELLFRGFLLAYLSNYMSMPIAVLLSSLLFGLGHLYQGWQGVLRTAVMGLIFAGIYLWSGSLFIVIALHFAVDAYSGQLHYGAYLKTKNTSATVNGARPSPGTESRD